MSTTHYVTEQVEHDTYSVHLSRPVAEDEDDLITREEIKLGGSYELDGETSDGMTHLVAGWDRGRLRTVAVRRLVCTFTDRDIRALSSEAGNAGDLSMVTDCDDALRGDDEALARVGAAIADARAQADD